MSIRNVCFTMPLASLALALAHPLAAQLRPYQPFAWELFDEPTTVSAAAGANLLLDQRASLAGTEGSLIELGAFSAFVRTGRVGIEVSGTAQRYLEERLRFADRYGGARADPSGGRRDFGDFVVSTTVLLMPPRRPTLATLRFGTRLPTTDNRAGLERDRTDFFALLGGRADRGPLRAAAELGLGIHGTREAAFEQSDVLVYLLELGLPRTRGAPALLLVGHADGLKDRSIRGNEELAEVRLRLRSGGRLWLQLQGIVGLTDFSPSTGVSVMAGATL